MIVGSFFNIIALEVCRDVNGTVNDRVLNRIKMLNGGKLRGGETKEEKSRGGERRGKRVKKVRWYRRLLGHR